MGNLTKSSRQLTAGEIRMARSIYKYSIDYNRVRIHNYPYFAQFAATPMQTPDDRNIYTRLMVGQRGYKADYSLLAVGVIPRYDFIHELAHIWQNQNNVLNQRMAVFGEIIRTFGNYNDAYLYDLDASNDLLNYSMEQQAAIIEDYFRLLEGQPSAYKPGPKKITPTKSLYQKVLANFLRDPKYPRAMHRQEVQELLEKNQRGSK